MYCLKVGKRRARGLASEMRAVPGRATICGYRAFQCTEETMSDQLDYEINKELGECYLFMGDFEKAEDYYRKAAAATTTQPAPFIGLATIAVQRGDLQNAMTLYSKALAIEENDRALAGMGLVKMETGAHADAFTYFEQALRLNPENAVAMNCIVREGYQLKRLEEVVPYLEAALAVSPDKEDVRISLAGCLISLGQTDKATEHLERVLAKNPANISANQLYDHLKAA